MTTTVILSCFNGSKYILEQLESLRLQTRMADEVLIGDDCSTDNTPSIIRNYIHCHHLTYWNYIENESNLGWKINFHKLIRLAAGDLIFLCDQDDVWSLNKIEVMAQTMENNPMIDVLACDVKPSYEKGSKKITKYNLGHNDSLLSKVRIDNRSVYVQRPGCSFCVRKSFLMEIEPYWDETWAHDAVIWVLSETKGALYILENKLVMFRRHDSNASARNRLTLNSRISDIEHLINRVEVMKKYGFDSGVLNVTDGKELEKMKLWLISRVNFLNSPNIKLLHQILIEKKRYVSFKGFLVDLYLSLLRK